MSQVKYEKVDDESFVKFRIADSSIIINKEHPFVEEHSHSKAEKELVRTVAMVNLLSDIYALDIGVEPLVLGNIRGYRDRLMRYRAIQSRQSGAHIARLLKATARDSENDKLLEAVLSDALRYLGFHVRDLAKNGEPEGIASAYPFPTQANPTPDNPHPPLYSFSFDAKSSKHERAKTNNINLANIKKHRVDFSADYSLVVAPGYESGNIGSLCAEQQVTPLSAAGLGKLLVYTVEYGAIPVTKFKEIFTFHEPLQVEKWVENLENWLKSQRTLTIDIFIKALRNLKGKVPEALPATMIAYECRENLKVLAVKDADVVSVAQGLAVLIPDLVGVTGDKIVVNASADRIAAAVQSQLEKLHGDENHAVANNGDQL